MTKAAFRNAVMKNLNLLVYFIPVFIVLSASFTSHENIYVSRTSLKIYLNTESPAYAALEDIRNEWTSNYLGRPSGQYKESRLTWGENKNLWVLEFSGLRKYTRYLSSSSPMVVKAELEEGINVKMVAPPEALEVETINASPGIDVSGTHPERVRVAQNLLKDKSWSEPNSSLLEQKLNAIIGQEKKNVYDPPMQPVVIKNGISINQPSSSPVQSSANSRQSKNSKEKYNRSYRISGNISMKGGLAFTGVSEQLKLYRVDDGFVLDEGFINIHEGYYEINVKNLHGYLIAELVTDAGDVRGYSELDLYQINLLNIKDNDFLIEKDIEIRPFKEGFNIKAISGLSFIDQDIPLDLIEKNGEQIVNEGRVDISIEGLSQSLEMDSKNQITSDMFTANSNMLVQLEAKNHWGTLAIGLGEVNKKLRVYKNSLVNALLGNYKETHDGYGVIWGRVLGKDGLPVRGAKVELAGENNIAVGPIYFNSAYLPDYSLEETRADGLFAFIKVLPGLHALKAKVNGAELPVELTISDSEKVSYLEIIHSGQRTMSLSSYNPLTGYQVETSLQLLGSDKIYDIFNGEKNLQEWPGKEGLDILESDPGPKYELTRHLISRKNKKIEVPVISKSWLKNIFRQNRINKESYKGIVVAFVENQDFEVYVSPEYPDWNRSDILYFDNQGRILPKKMGAAGGGFIMYNVTPGIMPISILPKKSEKIFTQLTIIESDFISVMSSDFDST